MAALLTVPLGVALGAGLVVGSPAVAGAAGCTKTWAAPVGGDWGDASNWSPAGAPTSADDVCVDAIGAYTVTASSYEAADSLTLGGAGSSVTLALDPGDGLALGAGGTIESGSTLDVIPSGGGSYLNGAGSLTNDGTITVPAGGTLTTGSLGGGGLSITNVAQGTFTDDGTVNIDGPFTDHGRITVGTGGQWAVGEGPTFVHAGGTIANSGSFTTSGNTFLTFIQSGGSIKGNPLALRSTTLIDSGGSGPIQLTYNDVVAGTIPAGQTVTILLHAFLDNATLTNNGTVEFTGSAGGAQNGLLEGALDNAGTLAVDPGSAADISVPFTNTTTGTVDISGYLAPFSPVINDGSFTVKEGGTFNDAISGSVPFTNTASGTVTNDGTFEVAGAGTSFTSNGSLKGTQPILLADTALIDQDGASGFVLWGTVTVTGTVPAGQTLHVQGAAGYGDGTLSLGGAVLTNNGTITLGTVNGNSSLIEAGGTDGSLVNNGTIVLLAPPNGVTGNWNAIDVPVTNSATGTILVLGGSAYLGDPYGYGYGVTLQNDGTLTFAAGAQIILEGGIHSTSHGSSIIMGATAVLNFTIDGTAGAPAPVPAIVQGVYGPDGSLVLGGILSITTLGAPHGTFSLVLGIAITKNFSLRQFGPKAYTVTKTASSLSVKTAKPFSLTPENLSGTAGQPTTASLAALTGSTAATYRVSVAWGDGATSAGTFTAGTAGGMVGGTHTYASDGTYNVTTTVTSSDGTTRSTTSTATISG